MAQINNRLSNFETLRNIAMFMILIIHANFVSLSRPGYNDLMTNTTPTIFRYFIESIGIVSVNVFVLISGWFKIKASLNTIVKFLFMVVFIWGGIWAVLLLNNFTEFSVKGFLTCFSFTSWDWFIKSYIVLIIISPILNIYLEHSSLKTQKTVFLLFFLYEVTYGWVGGASRFFLAGYGPLSFIPLYLIAHYCRTIIETKCCHSIFDRLLLKGCSFHLSMYLGMVIVNTIFAVFLLKYNYNSLIYAYVNPLTIIGSLSLLLCFSKIHIKNNRLINWLGTSSFAVYLVHTQPKLRELFTYMVNYIYINSESIRCAIYIFLFLIFVYVISVLIDQIRIFFWSLLYKNIKNINWLCTKI